MGERMIRTICIDTGIVITGLTMVLFGTQDLAITGAFFIGLGLRGVLNE